MKRRTKIILGLLLFGVIFIASDIILGRISHRQEIRKLSESLGCEPDLISIHQTIIQSFEIGMTRNEVYEKIIEMDPSMKEVLGTEFFRCDDGVINKCEEYLHFYSEQFGNGFGVGFIYEDMILKRVLFLSF